MKLILNESKFNLLIEERGVIPMIDNFTSKFVNYIKNTVFTPMLIDRVINGSSYNVLSLIEKGDGYNKFRISLKDTLNGFLEEGSWFKDVSVLLDVKSFNSMSDYSSAMNSKYNSGNLVFDEADIDDENRMVGAIIRVEMCALSDEMNWVDLRSILGHELGHMYSFYKKALTGNVSVDKSRVDIDKLKTANFKSNFSKNLAYILYVLNSEEIRAEVASVYQGLKELNSTEQTLKNDVEKLDAYIKYKQSKKVLNSLSSLSDESLRDVHNEMKEIVAFGGEDIYKWKNGVTKHIENGIKKLINGISRSVSKYNDDLKKN